jgi:mRNA-degrading endonuclease RelE of RelBE toxin-antitoxin system
LWRFKHWHQTRARLVATNWLEAKTIGAFVSGDYRVIYEIADEICVVRVNRVCHRREVYR